MKKTLILGLILAVTPLLVSACALNVATKEKITKTDLYGGDSAQLAEAINQLQAGIGKMTKAELEESGLKLGAKNVQCVRGAAAMPYIVGEVKNNVDLSTEEKIDAYAKVVSAYEACVIPDQHVTQSKSRWFFGSDDGKAKGKEDAYLVAFKHGILYKAHILSKKLKDEIDRESAWGGNMIEQLIGGAASIGRRFR